MLAKLKSITCAARITVARALRGQTANPHPTLCHKRERESGEDMLVTTDAVFCLLLHARRGMILATCIIGWLFLVASLDSLPTLR